MTWVCSEAECFAVTDVHGKCCGEKNVYFQCVLSRFSLQYGHCSDRGSYKEVGARAHDSLAIVLHCFSPSEVNANFVDRISKLVSLHFQGNSDYG